MIKINNLKEFLSFRIKAVFIIGLLFFLFVGVSKGQLPLTSIPDRTEVISSTLNRLENINQDKGKAEPEPVQEAKPTEAKEEIPPLKGEAEPKSAKEIKPPENLDKSQEEKVQPESSQEAKPIEEKDEELPSRKVSLNFKDVTLGEILNTLAKIADLNVVGSGELSQIVTIYLRDISFKEALDTVLLSAGYTYIKEGKILRVVQLKEEPLVTNVFNLKFVSAEQIRGVVSRLISNRGIIESFSKFSEEKHKNTLVVKDTPEVMKNIAELIDKLDKKAKQVMIEAKFVDVTLDKNTKLGIDWVIQASFTGGKGPTAFPMGTAGERLLEPPTITPATGTLTMGTISFEKFTATIEALETHTKTEVISNPRIAVRENEEAQIVVGDRVPIPLYERNEETGTMEVTGYQEEEIGVLLKVTPIINEDNSVTMRLHPEVSEITSYTGPNNERPVVSTREVNTAFTVEEGKTIVLGGLRSQTISKSDKKIPFIGSIPILGRFFSYKNDSDENRELLIFLTPHILNE